MIVLRLRESIRQKYGFLHHNYYASCHMSFAVQQILADKKMTTIPWFTGSSCNFLLFMNIQFGIKGIRFAWIEDIEVNAIAVLISQGYSNRGLSQMFPAVTNSLEEVRCLCWINTLKKIKLI